jgi:hypothetical protein
MVKVPFCRPWWAPCFSFRFNFALQRLLGYRYLLTVSTFWMKPPFVLLRSKHISWLSSIKLMSCADLCPIKALAPRPLSL